MARIGTLKKKKKDSEDQQTWLITGLPRPEITGEAEQVTQFTALLPVLILGTT